MRGKRYFLLVIAILILVPILSSATVSGQEVVRPLATVIVEASRLTWQPHGDYQGLVLTVSGPDDLFFRQEFDANATPTFNIIDGEGNPLPAGQYAYELRMVPKLATRAQEALEAASETQNRSTLVDHLRATGQLPQNQALLQSGYFQIENSAFVMDDASEGELESAAPQAPLAPADIIHNDDVIIIGSLCTGFDCVNGELFGFDTIRLKENNLRIRFQDTSTTASFPSNDWQITANDSSNGGANKFSIDDIDGGRTPFTIEAGAPSHSLYVDDSGRIGLGTSTPVVEAHLVNGDTPTVRLEQSGSSGFTPQTWDVAGNEANFFVRDVTNGSRLPFRIRPGAPTSSIDIASTGNVGIGDSSPDATLNVERSDGTARILVEETNATVAARDLLELRNNGAVRFLLANDDTGDGWHFANASNGNFIISLLNSGGSEFIIQQDGRVKMGPASATTFNLAPNGNLTIAGTLTQSSDVSMKENFKAIDGLDVLSRLADVPIMSWNFISDGASVRHLGPMAQDFYAAFGLGEDNRHIAPLDANGVALAGIQELYELVQDKDGQIAALQQQAKQMNQQNEDLEKRLDELEAMVNALLAAQAEGE